MYSNWSAIAICKYEILCDERSFFKLPHYIVFSIIIFKTVLRQNELKNVKERVQSSEDIHYDLNPKDAHLE